ncbi:MAG: sugar ABC transporter substrate-binding protein [Thermaceae bacterium]|nr:sugar ABC transporter substrate-binding protein [Thermaceae bacterium]
MNKVGKAFWKRLGLALGLILVLALGLVSVNAQGSIPYELKPGKPYNGTKIKFLICCLAAGQFAQLSKLTGEGSEFQQLTGITVEWENTPYESLQQKILVEATTGNTYDAVAWVDAWGEAIKPYLLPLNDRIKADKIDLKDYPSAYIQAGSDAQGNIVGLPLRGHPLILFYRKDIFDELKLSVPKTWQEVIRAAQTIQEKKPGMMGIAMYYKVNAGQNLFLWVSHLWGNGGDILDKNYHPIFNDERGVQATQAYIDLLRKYKVTSPAATTYAETESSTEMFQGRAAMWVGWWWYWARFSDPKTVVPQVLGKVGFAPAPGWGNNPPQTYALVWPIGIFKNSKKADAAWEFIKYVTNTDVQKKVASNRSDPAVADNTIVTFSGMEDPKVNEANGGIPKVGAEVLRTARTLPLVRTWAEIQSVLEVGINQMANGADVRETLNRMAKDVDAIQKRAGYYK